MLVPALALILAFQVEVDVTIRHRPDTATARPDTAAVALDSALIASAYLDPGARELVQRARSRRETFDQSISSYRVLAKERISVGINALRRERLLFRRETAARIHWRRYGESELHVLGAREVVPVAQTKVRIPEELDGYLPHLVFDPADNRLLVGLGDRGDVRHPLARGSEADYRFASGDTTTIRLPDERTVKLVELKLIPRRSIPNLLSGSLWLDLETHAVVQAVFRLARAFDLERDADDGDADDVPGILKPIRFDVKHLIIEYGLWELRWWMPRLVAFEGHGEAARFVRAPIRYERIYSDYEVVGDTLPLPPVKIALAGDTLPPRRCTGSRCHCYRGRCRRVKVHLPADSVSLLSSEHLPASAYDGEVLLSGEAIERFASILGRSIGAERTLAGPRVYWGFGRPDLVRYNRVEGVSLGARAEMGYGRLDADLTARLGLADLEPGIELGVERRSPDRRTRLAAYRRLAAADPAIRPFGLSNSFGALVFGRDDGDYFRALGVELSGGPTSPGPTSLDWRIYAERQRSAEVETDVTLPRLWRDGPIFRPNLRAERADQFGAAVQVLHSRGLDPAGFRWGAGLSLDIATGTFGYVRPSASLRLAGPVPGPLVASIEGAAGTSFGDLPAQSHWFLGGPATLRGYDPMTATGTAFWRGRAEIGTAMPAARVALFSDAGWAGDRNEIGTGAVLLSAGLGASLLDGLFRADLARAIRQPTGWRFDFYLDAAL